VDLFVNARCDVFLKGLTAPERLVEESISRGPQVPGRRRRRFFLPGVTEPADIRQVVSEVQLPLNVLVRAGLPRVSVLMELGVRRISAGSGISSAVHGLTRRAVRQFLDGGTYEAMLDGAMPYAS
jgi:2-methylisocitrate lyase-like PEP mutase family enzyme